MVITVYVHLFFTLPRFSLVKLWENKLHKKSFPRTVRDWRRYKINFGNLAVRELPFHLSYCLFGSLMPDCIYFTSTLFNLDKYLYLQSFCSFYTLDGLPKYWLVQECLFYGELGPIPTTLMYSIAISKFFCNTFLCLSS